MNKFHRYNHHSYHIPGVPDAGYDPIASYDSPFRGEFILSGMLSAASPLSSDPFSIVTDAAYGAFISAENITVTDTINAYYMNVQYLDVTVHEVTGMMISGTGSHPGGYISVPTTPWDYDVLTLQYAGLSSNAWAVFGGDVLLNNGLTASSASIGSITSDGDMTVDGCLHTDCIMSNTGSVVNMNSDMQFGNISGASIQTSVIWADTYQNLPSPTSSNIVINYNQGWGTPSVSTWTPSTGEVYDSLSAAVSTDRMITISIKAEDYRSYGEVFAYITDSYGTYLVAQTKIGNFGLVTNSNIDHAHSAGMFIDAMQPVTFMVPACATWYLSAANVYSNYITVDIVQFTEQRAWIEVVGDTLEINTVSAQEIYTNTLTATDSVTLSTLNFTGTAINISSNVYVSAFTNPVTADGWLVFNIGGTQKAVRLYDVTT